MSASLCRPADEVDEGERTGDGEHRARRRGSCQSAGRARSRRGRASATPATIHARSHRTVRRHVVTGRLHGELRHLRRGRPVGADDPAPHRIDALEVGRRVAERPRRRLRRGPGPGSRARRGRRSCRRPGCRRGGAISSGRAHSTATATAAPSRSRPARAWPWSPIHAAESRARPASQATQPAPRGSTNGVQAVHEPGRLRCGNTPVLQAPSATSTAPRAPAAARTPRDGRRRPAEGGSPSSMTAEDARRVAARGTRSRR